MLLNHPMYSKMVAWKERKYFKMIFRKSCEVISMTSLEANPRSSTHAHSGTLLTGGFLLKRHFYFEGSGNGSFWTSTAG